LSYTHHRVCRNKGQARVWLEGKELSDHGIKRGMKFFRTTNVYEGVLVVTFDKKTCSFKTNGTVSGKGDKPIIDMTGKWLTEFFGKATHFTATYLSHSIYIMAGDRPYETIEFISRKGVK
jgi:hypothetical protein